MGRIALILALLPLSVAADEIAAARNLPAGTILTHADLVVTTTARVGLAPADAVGKQLRSAVYRGRPISARHLTAPTVVNRNQLITLTYEDAALRIETEARALGAGGEGDLIRVMNLSSRATLMARINVDGTATVAQR